MYVHTFELIGLFKDGLRIEGHVPRRVGGSQSESHSAVYPVFVLGGVIVDRAYVRDEIEPAMRRFKQ
jgi:hypothetical protein